MFKEKEKISQIKKIKETEKFILSKKCNRDEILFVDSVLLNGEFLNPKYFQRILERALALELDGEYVVTLSGTNGNYQKFSKEYTFKLNHWHYTIEGFEKNPKIFWQEMPRGFRFENLKPKKIDYIGLFYSSELDILSKLFREVNLRENFTIKYILDSNLQYNIYFKEDERLVCDLNAKINEVFFLHEYLSHFISHPFWFFFIHFKGDDKEKFHNFMKIDSFFLENKIYISLYNPVTSVTEIVLLDETRPYFIKTKQKRKRKQKRKFKKIKNRKPVLYIK